MEYRRLREYVWPGANTRGHLNGKKAKGKKAKKGENDRMDISQPSQPSHRNPLDWPVPSDWAWVGQAIQAKYNGQTIQPYLFAMFAVLPPDLFPLLNSTVSAVDDGMWTTRHLREMGIITVVPRARPSAPPAPSSQAESSGTSGTFNSPRPSLISSDSDNTALVTPTEQPVRSLNTLSDEELAFTPWAAYPPAQWWSFHELRTANGPLPPILAYITAWLKTWGDTDSMILATSPPTYENPNVSSLLGILGSLTQVESGTQPSDDGAA